MYYGLRENKEEKKYRHNCVTDWPISDWEQSDPHVDYRFFLTQVEKCENLTRIREKVL